MSIKTKILLVVDMQNDFITGALGTKEAQDIIDLTAETIVNIADEDTFIVCTQDTHYNDYMASQEGKFLPVPHCVKSTDGWAINLKIWSAVKAAQQKCGCTVEVIEKPSFGSIDLQEYLFTVDDFAGPIDEINILGVCTGICVLSNAILCKASMPETPINVIENCCACVTPESHKRAIEAMKLCQINII